ncbi:regulatory protein RecX [Elusimicrobiota bacterium]
MIITKIEQQKKKKNYYSVFLDDKYGFSVSDENLIKFKLREDLEINEDIIEDINGEEIKQKAINSVWRLLSIRSRSRKELTERLKRKKFSDSVIDGALLRAQELGYINDAKFAQERYNYLREKGKGPMLIKMELKKYGIEKEVIEEIFTKSNFSNEDEIEQIANIAKIKLKKFAKKDPGKNKMNLLGFLSRRGFTIENIKEAFKKIKI